MDIRDQWKAWAGGTVECAVDLISPLRKWKARKRKKEQEERRRKREAYAKAIRYRNS
jgi:hypothetical protein